LGILTNGDIEAETKIGIVGNSISLGTGESLLEGNERLIWINVSPGCDLGTTLVKSDNNS